MLTRQHRSKDNGFTLVEMLIVVPILMLVLTGIVAFLVSLLNANILSNETITVNYDTQAALDVMERDIHISKTFLITNDSNFTDPYGPDNAAGAWLDAMITGPRPYIQPLILRMYATTTSVQNSNKAPVYLNTLGLGCGADVINSNPILLVNVIYFLKSGNLYRRVLTDTTQATCSTPYQQQTCPTDVSYPRNAICKGDDTLLLAHANQFYHEFYDASRVVLNRSLQTYIDSSPATSIYLDVNPTINGNPYVFQSGIFVRKLNQ